MNYPVEADIKWDNCKLIIRKGFCNLANNLVATGDNKNSLLVLERMINFTCFSTFYYLANVNAISNGVSGSPILIDAGGDNES